MTPHAPLPDDPHRNGPAPADPELWRWTALQAAEAIRTRRISSVELVTSVLGRITETNPALNALVEVDEESALAAAARADAELGAGKAVGILHGVPTTIKINVDQAGSPTSNGVASYADDVPSADSQVVAAIRRSGAVLVGRSNAPAFSFRWFTDNALHGATLNPWDPNRTPGGSSGGAASAVAAGMLPLAHGNDIGGSVRYPAYACGIAGLRPTVGLISARAGGRRHMARPSLARQLMSTQGPLARSVADLGAGLQAMRGFDPRDQQSVPAVEDGEAQLPRRVGVVRSVSSIQTAPTLDRAIDRAAAAFADAGLEVVDVPGEVFAATARLWGMLLLDDMEAMHAEMADIGDSDALTAMEGMRGYVHDLWPDADSRPALVDAWTRRNELLAGALTALDHTDLILTPPSAQLPFAQGADVADAAGVAEMIDAQWPATCLPVLGLPGLTLPVGGDGDGWPAGVQLIGPRFGEGRLLAAAALLEERFGSARAIDPREGGIRT